MLYYSGRIDLQIKLHGYRIELEDIENNLRRLPEIAHVVVIPNQRGGKVSSLTAFVVSGEEQEGSATGKIPEDTKVASAELKEKLAAFLPSYMIPKKFVFLEQMPMTNNGKADRKQLGGRV
jgi:D-alanine--poly(phosphoribitol) ligase subunit 1